MMRFWLKRNTLQCMNPKFLFLLKPKLISCISSYDELVNEYQVTYLAGGAAQNAARGAAVNKGNS